MNLHHDRGLDPAQVRSGPFSIRAESLDLAQVGADGLQDLAPTAASKGGTLEGPFEAGLPEIQGDRLNMRP
jgi:hypothetical protein